MHRHEGIHLGTAGAVRVRYADGDRVDCKIPVDGSFSFSQADGNEGGADRAVRICGVNGAVLVGSMRNAHGKVQCVSCDHPDNFGVGDETCEAIAPSPDDFTCP